MKRKERKELMLVKRKANIDWNIKLLTDGEDYPKLEQFRKYLDGIILMRVSEFEEEYLEGLKIYCFNYPWGFTIFSIEEIKKECYWSEDGLLQFSTHNEIKVFYIKTKKEFRRIYDYVVETKQILQG